MAAAAGGVGSPQYITLEPVGCDQCGSTSLNPVGGGKFQCAHCSAFMLEREPPPLQPPGDHGDPNRPPPSVVNAVSAVEVLALDARGEVAAPPVEKLGAALDRNGPKGFFRPSPLSRFVKVDRAQGFAPIRIQYLVFLERRRYEEVLHPYRGQVPVTTPLPPLWSEPLRPAREVTVRRIPVPGQQRISTCPRCSGAGWLTCSACGGDGRNNCPFCTGGVVESTTYRNDKWVTDRHTCTSCQGKGWQSCGTCHGKGRVTCEVCQGQTKVLCAFERVEEFSTPTTMHAISHGRDWSGYPWMHHAQGELLFDRVVQGRMDLTETDGPIAQLADQVLLGHNHTLEDGYPYWSRLMVTRVPVIEVNYRLRSAADMLHVYGRDEQVAMPGKKPVGCFGCLFWTLSTLGLAAATACALVAALI